jgi:signal transduction histidine kinase
MGLQLKIEIDQKGKFVSDKRRVNVILSNLLSNAIKYQDTKKKTLILNIVIHCTRQNARIEIEDNGIGIDQQHQNRIFEMFYRATTLSTGSGIGLYIVKEVIEKLAGSITLISELKKGTKITVVIPNLHLT